MDRHLVDALGDYLQLVDREEFPEGESGARLAILIAAKLAANTEALENIEKHLERLVDNQCAY